MNDGIDSIRASGCAGAERRSSPKLLDEVLAVVVFLLYGYLYSAGGFTTTFCDTREGTHLWCWRRLVEERMPVRLAGPILMTRSD